MKAFWYILIVIVFSTSCGRKHNDSLPELDKLLVAIDKEQVDRIKGIINLNRNLVNHADSDYMKVPLIRAIANRKMKSVEVLLSLGANPNIRNSQGVTPQIMAILDKKNGWSTRNDKKFLEVLLRAGANPNDTCFLDLDDAISFFSPESSMLMLALNHDQEKAKLLLNYGADINYRTPNNMSAAIEALINERLDIASFIIVDNHAEIGIPFYYRDLLNDSIIDYSEPHYAVELLLEMTYDLDSDEFKKKSQIINEFKRQGINYDSYKDSLNSRIMYRIKKLYPNNWRDYLRSY